MTNQETLELALNALKCLFGLPDKFTGEGGDVAVWRLGGSYRAQEAIKALEEALAQSHSDVKQEHKSARLTSERKWKLRNAFWRMYNHGKNDNPVSAQCEVQALDMFFAGDAINAWKTTVVPLHTTPHQCKPLTDEQAMDAYCETPPFGTYKEAFIAGIRYIEAAQGIKE